MITRTNTEAIVTIKGVNVETFEPETREMTVSRATAKDEQSVLKQARKLWDGSNGFTAVKVEHIDIPESMTGATEEDFAIIAVPLDEKRRPTCKPNYLEIVWKFIDKFSESEMEQFWNDIKECMEQALANTEK